MTMTIKLTVSVLNRLNDVHCVCIRYIDFRENESDKEDKRNEEQKLTKIILAHFIPSVKY